MNGNGNDWTLSRPVSLEAVLRPYFVSKALSDKRPYDVFHPSSWGTCVRQTAYEYYNYKNPFLVRTAQDINPRVERIFDNGHGVHARWQKYLDDMAILRGQWKCKGCGTISGNGQKLGILNPAHDRGWACPCGYRYREIRSQLNEYVELEVRSDPEFNFLGHCDAVVDLTGTEFRRGKYDVFVVDFKSINDENFGSLEKPEYKHVVQVNIYMWLLGLDAAVVLYENKSAQTLKEFFVPRNEDMIRKIQSESLALMDLLKGNRIPKRPAGMSLTKEPCRWCQYSKFCYC